MNACITSDLQRVHPLANTKIKKQEKKGIRNKTLHTNHRVNDSLGYVYNNFEPIE
jgi:hypothetical protein